MSVDARFIRKPCPRSRSSGRVPRRSGGTTPARRRRRGTRRTACSPGRPRARTRSPGPRPRSSARPSPRRRRAPRATRPGRTTGPRCAPGSTFGASPPRVTSPWTRTLGGSCWRSRPTATCATVNASAALTPCSGIRRRVGRPSPGRSRASARPRTAAPRRRRPGPGAPSSRGRGRRTHPGRAARSCRHRPPPPGCRRPRSSGRARRPAAPRASAAPVEDAAIRLWPQAWPRPGRASYSAQKPSRNGPEPYVARNAVSRPRYAGVTSNPAPDEHVTDPPGRVVLLPGRLRVGVQLLGEPDQTLARRGHRPRRVVPALHHSSPGTPYDGASPGRSPRVT